MQPTMSRNPMMRKEDPESEPSSVWSLGWMKGSQCRLGIGLSSLKRTKTPTESASLAQKSPKTMLETVLILLVLEERLLAVHSWASGVQVLEQDQAVLVVQELLQLGAGISLCIAQFNEVDIYVCSLQ